MSSLNSNDLGARRFQILSFLNFHATLPAGSAAESQLPISAFFLTMS
jgi:hypothetical protein